MVGGSIGAAVLIVLAMVPSIVSAQKIKTDEKRINYIKNFKDKLENIGPLRYFILVIYAMIFGILLIINTFLSGHGPY